MHAKLSSRDTGGVCPSLHKFELFCTCFHSFLPRVICSEDYCESQCQLESTSLLRPFNNLPKPGPVLNVQ